MADGTGGRKHHVFRAIAAAQEALQVGRGKAPDALGRSENRPPHGLARKRCVLQEVVGHVVGAVSRRGDLLQDYLPLALELRAPERRLLQDVGDEAERDALVALEHTGEISRRLDAGRRVKLAADLLDLLGDLLGATLLRPFEGHMLEKMRDPMLALALVAAPAPTHIPSDTVSRCGIGA